MKKIIFFGFLINIFFLILINQVIAASSFGVRTGFTRASIKVISTINSITSDYNYRYRYGLSLGGFYNYRYSNLISFQPELLFLMKGVIEEDYLVSNHDLELKLFYTDIPLLVKLNIPDLDPNVSLPFSIYVIFGPYFGFKIAESDRLKTPSGDTSIFTLGSMNFEEFGLVLGVGVDVDTKFGKLLFELRSSIALTPFYTEETETATQDIKNRITLLSAGIKFDI